MRLSIALALVLSLALTWVLRSRATEPPAGGATEGAPRASAPSTPSPVRIPVWSKDFPTLLEKHPDDAALWLAYGKAIHREARDPRDALEAFRRATELDPQMGEAHFQMGAALMDLGEFDDAAAAIEGALGLATEDAPWRAPAERTLALVYSLARRQQKPERPR